MQKPPTSTIAIENLRGALNGKRVAVVHDWLTHRRGGEKVLEAIADMLPELDLYCLIHNKGSVKTVETHPHIRKIQASWLNKVPLARRRFRMFFPIFNSIAQSLDLRNYDLVISISHCVAKNVRSGPSTTHICYCLSPARYAWDLFDDYWNTSMGRLASPTRPLAKWIQRRWQSADRKHSDSVTRFIAISKLIQQRIQRCYQRSSDLVYPPVETTLFPPTTNPRSNRFLVLSAIRPNKRVEEIIGACSRGGWALDVIGDVSATKLASLRQQSPEFIKIHGEATDNTVQELVPHCRALIHAATEDFGIAPVEAMAAGRPVIGYKHSGLGETVVDGQTGILFEDPSPLGIENAIRQFTNQEARFSSSSCQAQAARFSRPMFDQQFAQAVLKIYLEHSK